MNNYENIDNLSDKDLKELFDNILENYPYEDYISANLCTLKCRCINRTTKYFYGYTNLPNKTYASNQSRCDSKCGGSGSSRYTYAYDCTVVDV